MIIRERKKAGSLGISPLSSLLSLVRPPKPQPAMPSSLLKWAQQSSKVLLSLLSLGQQPYWAHSWPLGDLEDYGVVSSSVGIFRLALPAPFFMSFPIY